MLNFNLLDSLSKIYCHLFDTWTNFKTWSAAFKIKDGIGSIDCFAISNEHIFIASNNQLLHIFNYGGQEIDTIYTKLPVACVLASSNERKSQSEQFCLIYTNLECDVFKYKGWKIERKYSTRLPFNFNVKWATFTQDNLLACSSDEGRIAIFNSCSDCWSPIYSSAKFDESDKEFFWPVTISKQNIYGVHCEAESCQPEVNPSPIISKVQFNCQSMLQSSERNNISLPSGLQQAWVDKVSCNLLESVGMSGKRSEQKVLASLVKVFDIAANSNEYIAFEIAKLLPSVESLKICLKYAQKKAFTSLAKQLGNYIEDIEISFESK